MGLRLLAVISLLLFLFNPIIAETTYEYLVYRSSFSKVTYNNLVLKGKSKDLQPLRITNLFIAPNTNYAVLTVTHDGDTDITNYINNKSFTLLRTFEVKEVYDTSIGGNKTSVNVKKFSGLPNDFGVPAYIVPKSTP